MKMVSNQEKISDEEFNALLDELQVDNEDFTKYLESVRFSFAKNNID